MLCNALFNFHLHRLPNETSHIMTIISDHIYQVLNHLASEINYIAIEIQSKGFVNTSTLDSCGPNLASLKSLVSSPLFILLKKNSGTDLEHFDGVNQSLDALLMAFAKLFEAISENIPDSGLDFQNVPPTSLNSDEVVPFPEPSTVIHDMELDANSGSGDIDASKTSNLVVACSPLTYQMELVSIITTFFSILPTRAWEILYNCIGDEPNDKVGIYFLNYQ